MRKMTSRVGIMWLLITVILPPTRVTVTQTGIADDEIKSILMDRVDRAKKASASSSV